MSNVSIAQDIEFIIEVNRVRAAEIAHAFPTGQEDYILRTQAGKLRTFKIDWGERALHEDLRALAGNGCEPAVVQRVGSRLRRFLATTEWAREEQVIFDAAKREQQVRVYLRLGAAELFFLPWELLAHDDTGQHLGELPNLLLCYEWTAGSRQVLPEATGAADTRPALLMWSAAGGPVPAPQHHALLKDACNFAQGITLADGDVLHDVSRTKLVNWLKDRQHAPWLMHVLCHGTKQGQNHGLLWHDDGGRSETVDPATLRRILATHKTLPHLIVLAACDSGHPGAWGNHLGSIAQALHRAGVAYIVASRYPMSVRGSILFANQFYQHGLGRNASIESAFLAARHELATRGELRDWLSVQLFSRPLDSPQHSPGELDTVYQPPPVETNNDCANDSGKQGRPTWLFALALVTLVAGILSQNQVSPKNTEMSTDALGSDSATSLPEGILSTLLEDASSVPSKGDASVISEGATSGYHTATDSIGTRRPLKKSTNQQLFDSGTSPRKPSITPTLPYSLNIDCRLTDRKLCSLLKNHLGSMKGISENLIIAESSPISVRIYERDVILKGVRISDSSISPCLAQNHYANPNGVPHSWIDKWLRECGLIVTGR